VGPPSELPAGVPQEPVAPLPPDGTDPAARYQLTFDDEAAGCFHHERGSGSVAISGAPLLALRAAVVSSRAVTSIDATALGITQARTEQMRLESGITTLTVQDATAVAKSYLVGADDSTNTVSLRVRIPGDPPFVVSSQHGSPWMLPWTVDAGGVTWETYSPELPRALLPYLPATLPNHELLDGTPYWRDGFWTDDHAWGMRLGSGLERDATQRAVNAIPGYDALLTRFEILQASRGRYSSRLFLELRSKGPDLIGRVHWSSPLQAGKTSVGWSELQRMFAAAGQTAVRFGWLEDWRSRKPGRFILARFSGTQLHATDRLEYLVTPAWKHAGLPGEPSIELVLHQGDDRVADVFLAEAALGAILVYANDRTTHPQTQSTAAPEASAHWLDSLRVSFHPNSPDYVLTDERGRVEKRTIPAEFPPLRRAIEQAAAR
jgi:hypothetical protein